MRDESKRLTRRIYHFSYGQILLEYLGGFINVGIHALSRKDFL